MCCNTRSLLQRTSGATWHSRRKIVQGVRAAIQAIKVIAAGGRLLDKGRQTSLARAKRSAGERVELDSPLSSPFWRQRDGSKGAADEGCSAKVEGSAAAGVEAAFLAAVRAAGEGPAGDTVRQFNCINTSVRASDTCTRDTTRLSPFSTAGRAASEGGCPEVDVAQAREKPGRTWKRGRRIG